MDRIRNLGFLLKDLARLHTRHFEQCSGQLGLTLPQCKVIVYLSRSEGITQARLAEITETDPMTLVRIIDRMQEDGLIERRADATDRRAHRLHLRPAAQAVLAEILRVADRARAKVLAGLSAAEQSQLIDLLERMHANLTALVPGASDIIKASTAPVGRRAASPPSRQAANLTRNKRRKGT